MNRCRCYRLKEDQAICLFVGRDGKAGGELLLPLVVVALTLLGWKRSGKFITCQIHASDTVSGMLYFLLSANASKTLLFYLQLPWCVGAAAVVENTTNFHFNGSLGGLLGGVVVAAAAYITKLVAQQPADG